MKAVRLLAGGRPAELCDVARPRVGAGMVLIRTLAAGLCHSDIHVVDSPPGTLAFRPPFTLGHEIAGEVIEAAAGQQALVGRNVVVYAPWGCGECRRCNTGAMNYCDAAAGLPAAGLGLGVDGGLAEFVAVEAHRVVEIGDIDPVRAVPLTDAGLTTWSAIKQAMPKLHEGGTVLVIGVGGLGHLAIQLLRAATTATVVAVDTRPDALALSLESGAHHAVDATSESVRADLLTITPVGFDVVFDVVGAQATVDLACSVVRSNAHLSIIGSAGGVLPITKPGVLAPGLSVSVPFWGARDELVEVVAMAKDGLITPHVTVYTLEEFDVAFDDLRHGKIGGRAVLLPNPPNPPNPPLQAA